jgi:hypothetical protein
MTLTEVANRDNNCANLADLGDENLDDDTKDESNF